LLTQVLRQDDRLGELSHWTAKAAAFVPHTEIRFLFCLAIACLQNALGSFDKLACFELPTHFGGLFDEPGIFLRKETLHDRAAHLLAYESQERDFVGRVRMRITMVNVNDPNHLASAQQRDGKKRLIGIFNKSLE